MYLEVYVDVLFFINFIFNYLLLVTTKLISKSGSGRLRIVLSSLMASTYAVLIFLPSLEIYYSAIAKLIFSALLVKISFKKLRLKEFIKTLIIFYAVNFFFAGIAFCLFYFTDIGAYAGAVMNNGIYYINIPMKILLASSSISYFTVRIVKKVIEEKISKAAGIYNVTVEYNSLQINLTGFLDTANALNDPISGKPVIIAEFDAIKDMFSPEVAKCIYDNALADAVSHKDMFRLIPYRCIGNEGGILLAFKPDRIVIHNKNITEPDALIALNTNKLSASSSYNILLHPQIFANI